MFVDSEEMRERLLSSLAFVAFLVACPAAGSAQGGGDTLLARAQEAYANVNYEETRRLAQESLEEGGHGPRQLAMLYRLLGLCQAALGEGEEARTSFSKMIEVDPDESISEDVAPRLRAPFLEARGTSAALGSHLALEVSFRRASHQLDVELRDPLSMGRRIIAQITVGDGEPREMEEPAAEEVHFEVDAGNQEVRYYIWLADEYGNRLTEIGSADAPEVAPAILPEAEPTAATPVRQVPEPAPPAEEGGFWESPWLWIVVGVLVAGGLAAGGVGLFYHPSRIGQVMLQIPSQ